MVYKMSSRTTRATHRNPVSQRKQKKQKEKEREEKKKGMKRKHSILKKKKV